MIEVELPDGRVVEIETDDPNVAASAARKFMGVADAPEKPPGYDDPGRDMTWPEAAKTAIGNIPSSAAKFGAGLFHAATNPVETIDTLRGAVIGGIHNLRPSALEAWLSERFPQLKRNYADPRVARDKTTASAVGDVYTDRYGGAENIKQTLATDPVGMAADVSLLATPFSALPGAAGRVAGGVATATNPLTVPIKAASIGLEGIGRTGAALVGELGTHTGTRSMLDPFRIARGGDQASRSAFLDNLRGNAPASSAVQEAKAAVDNMAASRSADYRAGMADIAADTTALDFRPIQQAVVDSFKVGTYKGQVISESAAGTFDKILEAVKDWGRLDPKQYHTAEGLDALKRKIGDIRDSTEFRTPSRAIADRVYSAVRNQIVDQAPDYARTMRGYEQASEMIREIEKTLSLTPNATIDTALRKLQSVLRNNANTNYGRRVELADLLVENGATNLMERLTGQQLSALAPRGLGRLAASGAGVAGLAVNPLAFAALPFTSPRLMGEASYGLGRVARGADVLGAPLGAANRGTVGAAKAGELDMLLRELTAQDTDAERRTEIVRELQGAN